VRGSRPHGAQGKLQDMRSDAAPMGERVVARLHAAMNAHDVEAFVACFAEDYDSAQPAHPDRAFRGREQVRANWSAIFNSVPDFRAELVGATATGETAWSEWRWEGTQTDGERLDMAGVIVFGVRDEAIAWARLYVEPVEEAGAGIDAAVRDMTAQPYAAEPGSEA
jgi:ketosteroid isomerase-like protein